MTIKESLPHTFTPEEKKALHDELLRANTDLVQTENAKSASSAAFSATLKDLKKKCAGLSAKLNAGFEYRSTECDVLFNTPVNGKKQIVRLDNGEVVRDIAMTDFERQESLPFDGDGGPKKGKK